MMAFRRCSHKGELSVLTIINSYPITREESSLVDVFVLEILANYLESLSLAHNDDQARGTATTMGNFEM